MPLTTAERYRGAAADLAQNSPLQSGWATAIADDEQMLAGIRRLPRLHRAPSLLFSVAAYLGAPAAEYPRWRSWVMRNWDHVRREAATRLVQTNEPGRCAPLVTALAAIPGPISLIEVEASAGLCLLVDRYAYEFETPRGVERLGIGDLVLPCRMTGAGAPPTGMPEIVWRWGIDLAPLDPVGLSRDRDWLAACIPQDRTDRRERMAAAVDRLAARPVSIEAGDLFELLPLVAALAPRDTTLVVASLGTAVFLTQGDRARYASAVAAVGARSVTLEGVAVFPEIRARAEALSAPDPTSFLLAIDGEPIGYSSAHGDALSWLT